MIEAPLGAHKLVLKLNERLCTDEASLCHFKRVFVLGPYLIHLDIAWMKLSLKVSIYVSIFKFMTFGDGKNRFQLSRKRYLQYLLSSYVF